MSASHGAPLSTDRLESAEGRKMAAPTRITNHPPGIASPHLMDRIFISVCRSGRWSQYADFFQNTRIGVENRRLRSSTPRGLIRVSFVGMFSSQIKDNVSSGAGYVDDESADELDPNRVCVPDLVVEEHCEQRIVRDNQRPPKFHGATIRPTLCDHKRCVGPFTLT